MKISELITALDRIKNKDGDLDVYSYDSSWHMRLSTVSLGDLKYVALSINQEKLKEESSLSFYFHRKQISPP